MKQGDWHHLCKSCDNLRRHPPSSADDSKSGSDSSPVLPLFERDQNISAPLSMEERYAIIAFHKDKQEPEEIARKVGCSIKTVKHWISYYDINKNVEDRPRTGRPKITDENSNINIGVTAIVEPFSVPKTVKHALDLDVSARTVRRRMDDCNLFGRIARLEYPFTKTIIKKRLSFSNGYVNWNADKWSKVIYSDETHIELGAHGQNWVQRPVGKAFDYHYMVDKKMPHPPRVSVWACFSKKGVGEIAIFTENLDAKLMKKILDTRLIKSANRLFPPNTAWWFLQDNDPKHKSKLVQAWIHNKGIQCIDFPPYSPDCNPIENLWHDLKGRVEKHNATNIQELEQHIVSEWKETNKYFLNRLSNSMPDRCQAVIDNEGHLTKY